MGTLQTQVLCYVSEANSAALHFCHPNCIENASAKKYPEAENQIYLVLCMVCSLRTLLQGVQGLTDKERR